MQYSSDGCHWSGELVWVLEPSTVPGITFCLLDWRKDPGGLRKGTWVVGDIWKTKGNDYLPTNTEVSEYLIISIYLPYLVAKNQFMLESLG